MVARQILKDPEGMPTGVFIPIQTWNRLIVQYRKMEYGFEFLPEKIKYDHASLFTTR